MAWTGTPTVKALGANMVRISGASLAGGATAIIGLFGDSGADTQLPATFPSASDDPNLTMSDLVEARFQRGNQAGLEANHIHVDKGVSPFRITISNDLAISSGTFDLYVQYHHSITR